MCVRERERGGFPREVESKALEKGTTTKAASLVFKHSAEHIQRAQLRLTCHPCGLLIAGTISVPPWMLIVAYMVARFAFGVGGSEKVKDQEGGEDVSICPSLCTPTQEH